MKKVLYPFLLMLTVFLGAIDINNASAQPVLWQCNQCALVTNLTVTGTTNTTVDLSWNHIGGHCGFIIDAVDNNNGTITTYNVPPAVPNTPITYTVTGLTPLTYYTFYVRQVYSPHPGDPLMDCAPEEVNAYTTGDGIGCDCDYVHSIQFTNITNTTADLSWLTNAECQDFYVTVTDMNNPSFSKTYIVLSATNFTLTGLTAGGFYKVWVRVISDAVPGVDCIPEEAYFSTTHDGIDCWDCIPPLSVNVQNITQTSAYLTWVPGSPCNDFEIYVFDNTGSSMQVYSVTGTSYTLTGLLPSRSYTVFVAVKSVQVPPVSCLGTQVDFTTLHCGNFTNMPTNYVQTLIFGNPSSGIVYNAQQPYISSSNSFNFTQGGYYQFAFDHICQAGTQSGTIHANVWFDFNNDGVFSSNEQVTDAQFPYSGGASFLSRAANNGGGNSCGPCGFTAPNQAYYGLKGRCIISFNDAGPCGPIDNGQVLDFIVNIQ